MGKGSAPRPFSVSSDEYASRWDAIFQREPVKTFQSLENDVEIWGYARGIIKNGKPLGQAKKTIEEAEELLLAVNSDNKDEIKDAVGDIVVTLIMQCAIQGFTLTECLEAAYNEIKDRKGFLNEQGVFVKEV